MSTVTVRLILIQMQNNWLKLRFSLQIQHKAFGIDPRIAMISYSTGTSGAGADVEKVAKATEIAKQRRPDLLIDGPLQYDAASVESVGQSKAPGSPVAGRANV